MGTNEEKVDNLNEESTTDPLFAARDHDKQFDPVEYLEGFYKTPKEDDAMKIVLFFLPGSLYRVPDNVESLLDLGAGPTVYVPIAVRKRVQNIYTSDYAEANRNALQSWMTNTDNFNWSNVCNWLSSIEASAETPMQMQLEARQKMRAVLEVNVHKNPVVQNVHYKHPSCVNIPTQFDVVTTIFCLEYASETLSEYENAVANAVSLIKPGGHLIQGGVMNADEYSFGGKRFKCHHLTKNQLLGCLKDNGMCTDQALGTFKMIENDDIFIVVSQKLL